MIECILLGMSAAGYIGLRGVLDSIERNKYSKERINRHIKKARNSNHH